MSDSPRRFWGREGLGLWIWLPLLALYALLKVAVDAPDVECGEGGGASGGEEALILALTVVLSLTACGGAALRIVRLRGAGGWRAPGRPLLFGAVAVLLTGLVFAIVDRPVYFFFGACLAGLALTAVAFLALLVAWARRRSVDEVGALLPVYLLGAGIFCYPLALLITALGNSGLGC